MANKLTFADGNVSLKNITEYPNSFKRQGAFPLERFSVFNTMEALKAYATSNPVAYVGQILALVTETADKSEVTIYSIQDDKGTLAEVGKATSGDDEGISLAADTGVLSLKNWGKSYWKEIIKTVDGNETTSWEEVIVDAENPWVEGLVPKVASTTDGFELRWYVPSTKDVEGLTHNISTINDRLDTIDDELHNKADLEKDNTFRILPEVPITAPIKDTQVASKKYVDDENKKDVHLTGDQSIAGTKTFTTLPEVPTTAPTKNAQVASKKYVDDTVGSKVSELGEVMTIAQVYATEDEFNALAGKVPAKWSDGSTSKAGDVVLVKYRTADDTDPGKDIDATKEYVVVKDGSGLRFEFLGEASGVTQLKTKVTNLENTINDIADDDGSVVTEGLKTKVTNLEKNLGKTTDDGKTESTKDTAFSRIKVVEDAINDVKDPTTGSVVTKGLKTKVTNLESDVTDINTAIGSDTTADTIKYRIKTVENAINDTKDSEGNTVQGIKSKVDNINTAIGNDTTENTIKYRIKTIENVINDTTKDGENVDGLKTTVAKHTTKLDKIEDNAQVNKIEAIKVTGNVADTTADIGANKIATITLGKVTNATNADNATTASKVKNPLTFKKGASQTKSFDGNAADITVTIDDLVDTASATTTGLVKSSTGVDHVTVDTDGTMTVSKVSSAATADKVANALKIGDKTFDGSTANVEVTLTDLGFKADAYATKAQGNTADSALQSVKVAGKTLTKGSNEITTDDISTALGLGTASKKADTYFATADNFDILNTKAVKIEGNQTIAGVKTFSSSPVVPTPTADNQAANKGYVDDTVATKIKAANAMRFMGLLDSTHALPSEGVQNGDTYKVAEAGTYASQAAKAGDMFIALVTASGDTASITWQYIPSADDGNVSTADSNPLSTGSVVVGANNGQTIKTLAKGTTGQILRQGANGAEWSDEKFTTVASADKSITVTKSGNDYDLAVASVNCNKLTQTDGDYLIFDCGSSSELIAAPTV